MSLPVYHEAVKQFKPKVYTEMARVAVRNGQAPALRVWSALRAMDRTGCGIVGKRELRAFQRAFAVSDADLRYADAISAGVFFQISTHYIEYRSLEHVCVALGVKPGRVHTIELADLRTVQRFKASCYAAWLSGDEPKNISRKNLVELWNHSEDTLRRWERARNISVAHNVGRLNSAQLGTTTEPGPAWDYIPRDDRPAQEGNCYTWTDRHGVTYFRSVNSYQAFTAKAPRGMARKVARRINAQRQAGAVCGGATTDVRRAFYDLSLQPANYQMTPGPCLIYAGEIVANSKGIYSVWDFSQQRPVSRAFAFWQG